MGKFSLLQMAKYFMIIQPSGHTAVGISATLFRKNWSFLNAGASRCSASFDACQPRPFHDASFIFASHKTVLPILLPAAISGIDEKMFPIRFSVIVLKSLLWHFGSNQCDQMLKLKGEAIFTKVAQKFSHSNFYQKSDVFLSSPKR